VKKLLLLPVIFLLSACLKEEPFKLESAGITPSDLHDGIVLSTPEAEHMDLTVLQQAYDLIYRDDRYLMARSLLVFRNGKLVAEAYPHSPDDIGAIQNIQSCTKSFTSILTGIALQEQLLDSLNEPLYGIYPEWFDDDTRKRTMTIADALTMRTGLDFDNDDQTLDLYSTQENSAQFVLARPYLYPPGTVVNYNDGAPQLLSKAIEKKAGKILADFAQEKLFGPLGISNWKWEAAKDGTTFGAFSLFLRPRDFGKAGLLLANYGRWNATVLVDSSYLADATAIHVAANFHSEPYGYYFWILPAYGGYAAIGHGGQFLLVVPGKQLVAVYTAWPYTNEQFFDERNELMSLIVQSCL
jgi:CubicO group peptidase (beta-lactamase class C family)